MGHFPAVMLKPIAIFISIKMAGLFPESPESSRRVRQGPWGLLGEGPGYAHSRGEVYKLGYGCWVGGGALKQIPVRFTPCSDGVHAPQLLGAPE